MFWKKTHNHCIPHMMMTLKRRFKGKNNLRWHCVPLADQTKSGIPTRRCISRIIYRRCELENQERGFLFARNNGSKAGIGDYDTMFRNLLERGKNMHPYLFATGVLIGEFSLRRSPRSGATTEVDKKKLDTTDIELINRRSKRGAARGTEAGLSMR